MSAICGKRRSCSISCATKKIAPIPVTPMPLGEGQRSADRSAEGQAGRPRGADAVRLSSFVMAGLDPAIHVFCRREARRGCPGHRRRSDAVLRTAMTGIRFEFVLSHEEIPMSANNALHIAVLGGDGIGPEVMAPALEVLRKIEATIGPASSASPMRRPAPTIIVATGKSMPESTMRLCDEADAILLGACGLPSVRYPDNTEIMPQVELRFHFDLYAGVRPARLIPGVPSPIVGADQRGIDLVVIRESTEGLFASMGKGVVTDTEARETLVITRKTSERLFEFSFRLAERRKRAAARPGQLTCVDKANVFKAFAFFREMFDEAAKRHPGVKADRLYVDACSALLVKRPWDFDVMVMENMFGDILSDIDRRPDRRHGHGALGRHRRPPRRVPALPRHRARHHGAGQGQPDRR